MHDSSPAPSGSRALLVFCVFAAIGLAFLVYEHRVHALGLLPFLILALCPVLHLFLHGRHGHGDSGDGQAPKPRLH